jgi:hypothetical protein
MTALLVLGAIDFGLSAIDAAVAGSGLAGLAHASVRTSNMMIGLSGAILVAQALFLRVPALVARAFWTQRQVRNLHLFHAIAVTPAWALAGFFVPVVSLWLPVRMMLVLGRAGGRRGRVLGTLCLGWAVMRWLTCLSGVATIFMALVAVTVYRAIVFHLPYGSGAPLVLALFLTTAIAGLVSSALGLMITPWIGRRQPKPDELRHAEVFT